MIRIAFAVLLLLHGAVHVIGFLIPWRLSTSPDFAYSTTCTARRTGSSPQLAKVARR